MATHTPVLSLVVPHPVSRRPEHESLSWTAQPPALHGARATLRELTPADAEHLLPIIASPEVARFISPPPLAVDRFARFIAWSVGQRRAGRYVVFGLVPRGADAPVGIVQLRQLEADFRTGEWGIAMDPRRWGSGLFREAAHLLFGFAFEVIGVHRLEARAAAHNARAQVALAKLGATPEGVLRRSLTTADGTCHDQVLWSVLDADWRELRDAAPGRVH